MLIVGLCVMMYIRAVTLHSYVILCLVHIVTYWFYSIQLTHSSMVWAVDSSALLYVCVMCILYYNGVF